MTLSLAVHPGRRPNCRLARVAWRVAAALLPIAVAVSADAAHAQDRRPITVDGFLSLRVAGDPQVSPDGSIIAFTVTTPSLEEDRNISRVWLHRLADGSTRELTSGAGSDQSPRWAPDGRTLAFLSTRSGSAQVWRIRTDGGEPSRLTNVDGGVSQFYWSPDTTALFVVSDLKWPAQQEIDRLQGEYPTSAGLWSNLFYRHWNEWRGGRRQHLFRISLTDGTKLDLTPFDRDVPTLALGGRDVGISPLGTELAIVYNPDSVVATSTNNDIFLVGPDGTGMVAMTSNPANDHSPVYAPSARWIAYLAMEKAGFESDRQHVVLYDRATGEHQPLVAEWDASVSDLTWTPDSRALVVEVEERGEHNLYRVTVPEGNRTLLVRGGVNSSARVLPDGSGIVFVRQTAAAPPDLFVHRFGETGPAQRLTTLNDARLASVDLRPLEPFAFVGAVGDSIHGWLMKPPGFQSGQTYPLVYLIHGGPQGAWLDSWHLRWNYAVFASRGYVVAGVNFHGSTGYGQSFTNSISGRWGDLPYDDLMKGLDAVTALPFVDGSRVGAAGASYGGYMIYWMAGQTDRFRTLVAHDGIYNTESMAGTTEELWFTNHEFGGPTTSAAARELLARWSPARNVEQWKTPMLVVHGQQDFRVDVSEGLQAFTALQTRGIPSRLLYFPDEGHFVVKPRNRRLWWNAVLDWLDSYLKPPSP